MCGTQLVRFGGRPVAGAPRVVSESRAILEPMVKPRLYLDTSVLSAYFDDRAPDRQRLTQRFWEERLPEFEGMISESVLQEISDTPDEDRRSEMRRLAAPLAVLDYPTDAEDLAYEYVKIGIFPQKYLGDAIHVAIASVHRVGYLASWNFKHLVRVATRREVNLVNALKGYDPLEIAAPPEI